MQKKFIQLQMTFLKKTDSEEMLSDVRHAKQESLDAWLLDVTIMLKAETHGMITYVHHVKIHQRFSFIWKVWSKWDQLL